MFLSDASLRRPVAMSTIILTLLVIGAFSYVRLGLDFLPRVDFPYVTVTTVYPGAGPRETEQLISEIIEDAVSEIDGIKHVRSTSMENVSQVLIEFEMGTDVDFAAMDVREKVDLVRSDLPDDAEAPIILKFDVNAQPIMNLALAGDRPLNELYDLADEDIKDQLTKIPGLASVELVGGERREIQVLVDQERLAAQRLTIHDIVAAFAEENIDLPSGHITEERREYSVRMDGKFRSLDEMRLVDLRTPFGGTIPISEVAQVVDTVEDQREIARFDGAECVGMVLKKRGDANTVSVVARATRAVDEINRMLPPGVRLTVINEDASFIKNSVDDVIGNMLIGVLLTALILYLFLHDLRQTLIAALSMPASIVATFSLIYFAGFTLNVMSLMALGISVGILVTNAIVVLENIHRHMSMGKHVREAAADGTSEITLAVLGSTLTNVVVFLPIAFMSGMVGQFFRQFGLTVTFATAVSLFISFTLTPILASMLLTREAPDARGLRAWFFRRWDAWYERLAAAYRMALGVVLHQRPLLLAGSLAALIASFSLAKHLGSELTTDPDRGQLTVIMELPPGTPLAETDRQIAQLESSLREELGDLLRSTYVQVGKVQGLMGRSSQGVHLGEVLLLLVDKGDRVESAHQIQERVRGVVRNTPGAIVTVMMPTAVGGSEAAIQAEVYGDDLDNLHVLSERIREHARQVPGIADLDTSWRSGKPELSITPRRQRIKDFGLSVAHVAGLLRANVEGFVAGEYREGSREYDIRVKLAESGRENAAQVRDFLVPLVNGSTVPLYTLAEVEETEGPTQILRKDKQRIVVVSANAAGRSVGQVTRDVAAFTETMDMPAGYGVYYAGEAEYMEESFRDIYMALFLAVLLTYLVLAALLESFIQPLTIMLTVPLALIGVFVSLFLTGNSISIFSLMSVVMLVGIVVNNAILMIDYTTVLRAGGKAREDALLEACPVKLRPVIMTTAATIFGMLPIALGLGWGAEMRAPMAIVAIGGLVVSTLLSLFVIPVVYTLSDDVSGWLRGRGKVRAGEPDVSRGAAGVTDLS